MITEELLKHFESDTDNYRERIELLIAEIRSLRDVYDMARLLLSDPDGDLDAFSYGVIAGLRSSVEAYETNGSERK